MFSLVVVVVMKAGSGKSSCGGSAGAHLGADAICVDRGPRDVTLTGNDGGLSSWVTRRKAG
ncbi:MAG: hypothetical protein K0R62_1987 [Nonomuraea muscovyensis]|nr:hypothetical protein [Nonomuraea muscovyensis]